MTELSEVKIQLPQDALMILRELLYFLPKDENIEVWLVGGAVRDSFLGTSPPTDFDLAISHDPTGLARKYADSKKAGFVVLDEERKVVRVVRSMEGIHYTIDIACFRDADIIGDLKKRDFTMNAMAVKLEWPMLTNEFHIFDPLSGVSHIAEKRIVPCSDELFVDDPLRLMRAVRFASTFNFMIEKPLLGMIRRDAHLISGVSGERIRDELFKILDVNDSTSWIRVISESSLLACILPELEKGKGVEQNEWHHLDVFDHTLLALSNLEKLMNEEKPFPWWSRFQQFLLEPISGAHTFSVLTKFACLLHDLGKPECRKTDEKTGRVVFHGHEMAGVTICDTIGERLKLSSVETQFLRKVVKNHMRPGVIIQEGLTDRKLFRYFSETGRDGLIIALLSLADRMAALGIQGKEDLQSFSQNIFELMSEFYNQMEYPRIRPILTGTDLIAEFKVEPGPIFKDILEALKEAQHLGTVTDRNQALEFVSNMLFRKQ